MTASGVLRGWVSNSVLRRATDDDKVPDDAAARTARAADRPMLPPMPCCEKKWLSRS